MTMHRYYRRRLRAAAQPHADGALAALLAALPPELHDVASSLPPIVTVERAAELCGCTTRAIRGRVARGELASIRSAGGRAPMLIPRASLLTYFAAHLTPARDDD